MRKSYYTKDQTGELWRLENVEESKMDNMQSMMNPNMMTGML